LHLFDSFTTNDFFPDDEPGAILSIVKHCRVLVVPKNEYVIHYGELGLEMYFILTG
jgi:hypothetical protein